MIRAIGVSLLALAFSASVQAGEPPRVAVSIKPIHSLISGVMLGLGEPTLIVKGVASPHHYALKPSEVRELNQSHVVFWVGPKLEGFLVKPLEVLSGKIHEVKLSTKTILSLSRTDDTDLHMWLDPRKARAIVAIAVAELSTVDPDNADQYKLNGQAVSLRIDRLIKEIEPMLSPLSGIPFIVYHDAYNHLKQAYNLNIVGSVVSDPEIPAGPQHLADLRYKIQTLGVRCIFQEPQHSSPHVYTLIDGLDVGVGFLDAIGGAREPGLDLYFQLMWGNADSLSACLTPSILQ